VNTTTLTAELPRAHTRRWSSLRLASAEFLKLRKRRGLVVSALVLTLAPMIVAYIVLAILHARDPAKYGPPGSLQNFSGSMEVLTQLSAVTAILVGATLGAGDLRAGVFRELVVTGRSRLALFAARVPAGLALLGPLVGGAFAITTVAATLLAGSSDAPSGSLLVHSAGWLALVTAPSFALALGVSSLLGSRGTSIGILLGWQLVAMPLLVQFGAVGALRQGLVDAATNRLAPAALVDGSVAVPMSLGAAVVVLVAWIAVPLAVGAWRTCTRDA
jgi:ABC-type transport system involved in multi-copper enzyme maturation permease subunit